MTTDDLAYHRRVQKAKKILADPSHPYSRRLADELDAWGDLDNDADDCPPSGIGRPLANLPEWGLRRRARLIDSPLP